LVTYRRFRSMTGVENRLVREREDVSTNRMHERLEIAPGQVGSANRPGKNTVPDHRDAAANEDHVSGGVPRRMVNSQFTVAEPDRLAFDQVLVDGWRRGHVEAEPAGLRRHAT